MNFWKKIKKVFVKTVDPLINLLIKLKISPNVITTSALFFLIITSYIIMQKRLLLSGLMLACTGLIDALDGAVAKKVGSTRFGDFYDAFIDRLVEAVIYLVISVTYPSLYIICYIAFTLSYLTSYVAARAEVWTIGLKIKYLGIGSRPGRLTILVFAFLFNQLRLGLFLISIVAFITVIGRSIITFKRLRETKIKN